MVSMVSPGVSVTEVDLTTVIPSASSSVAAFVGNFGWGPVELPTLIGSENILAKWFGSPRPEITSTDFLIASQYLAYSGALKLVRVVDSAARNANSDDISTLVVKNETQFEDGVFFLDNMPAIFARYPSAIGNSLVVTILTHSNYNTADDALFSAQSKMFESKPNTGEVHILVTMVGSDAPLERFGFVSLTPGAKKDGANNYIQDVIMKGSMWIYVGAVTSIFTSGGSYSLSGGVDSLSPSEGDLIKGWDLFANQEDQEDVTMLIAGAVTPTVARYVVEIAETRIDCVTTVSPERSDVVGVSPIDQLTNVVNFFRTSSGLNKDTSYAIADSGWKYTFNKYLDKYEWVPLCGDIAGLMARTDLIRDPWVSPAGYERGTIKNCVKLAFNPDKTARDELYRNGINPVVSFRGSSPMLYGDKTLQSRPSAFDRINVRRLFITLERAISKASRYQLFDFNDQFTRSRFVNMVEPYLREVEARRGIEASQVVCDTSNNTPEVINTNGFVGDIYIKPNRSINFIQLNFISVRSGVTFSEIVGKF